MPLATLLVLALAAGSGSLSADSPSTAPVVTAETAAPTSTEKLLADQQAAWNRGDLEGYMAGYWRSSELTFFSGASITKGWQPTLDRYRKRYQGEGREMGQLTFSELEVSALAGGSFFARGRWHLKFKEKKPAQGVFTLLLRHVEEGLRIVHDHSSGE